MLLAKNTVLALCVTLISVCAGASECHDLKSLGWLLGSWQQASDKALTRETWTRVSASTFEGIGETLSPDGGEQRTMESLRLVSMQDTVFYLAKVSGNERPVAFELTHCGAAAATFENPQHDFPRKLEYTMIDRDTLRVAVSDGGERGFELRLERRSPEICEDCDE